MPNFRMMISRVDAGRVDVSEDATDPAERACESASASG